MLDDEVININNLRANMTHNLAGKKSREKWWEKKKMGKNEKKRKEWRNAKTKLRTKKKKNTRTRIKLVRTQKWNQAKNQQTQKPKYSQRKPITQRNLQFEGARINQLGKYEGNFGRKRGMKHTTHKMNTPWMKRWAHRKQNMRMLQMKTNPVNPNAHTHSLLKHKSIFLEVMEKSCKALWRNVFVQMSEFQMNEFF